MKKLIYLSICAALFAQPVQAGRYFDVFQDDDGNQALRFKKSGHKFDMALKHVSQAIKANNVKQIYFHEDVSEAQQQTVYKEILATFNLRHNNNGLLMTPKQYDESVQYLKFYISKNPSHPNVIALDLQYADKKTYEESLPLVHQTTPGLDQINHIHLGCNKITKRGLKSLHVALLNNTNIKTVTFYNYPDEPMKTSTIIQALLNVPGKRTYYFDFNALRHLSPEILETTLKNYDPQRFPGRKMVLPHISSYINYNDTGTHSYKAVCESRFSPIFKASFPADVNEEGQKKLLQTLQNDSLQKQSKAIAEVLYYEESKYKSVIIYKDTFLQIQQRINSQIPLQQNTQAYRNLEAQKRQLIQTVLERMG